MEYEQLSKSYEYGLPKIYEMVINNDPCYAYLLECNPMVDQKLVMAHVYGHCDFFKNNFMFAHTNRHMIDEMANHATRVRRYIERFGLDKVESFIDSCLSHREPDRSDVAVHHAARVGAQREGGQKSRGRRRDPALPRQGVHGGVHQPAEFSSSSGGRWSASASKPLKPGDPSATCCCS